MDVYKSITYVDPYAAERAEGVTLIPPTREAPADVTEELGRELYRDTHTRIRTADGTTLKGVPRTITAPLGDMIYNILHDKAHIERRFDGERPKVDDICAAAGFSPATWNRITGGKLLDIERGNVFAIALALRLDEAQTVALMASAGFLINYEFQLDAAVMFFIHREIYDMELIRTVLSQFADIKNGLDRFHF